MEVTGLMLKQGILLFWALWISIAWLSNLCEALKACHWLGTRWKFASGNYVLLIETTQKYRLPFWFTALLFVGILFWQGCAAILFWCALVAFQGVQQPGEHLLYRAFLVNLALWAAFLIADEIFLAYETEDTHLRVFIAQVVSLLALALLPDAR
jgi:hypothetical protein